MSGRRQNTNHRRKVRRTHFLDQAADNPRAQMKLADQLAGTGLSVRRNGRVQRYECGHCAWFQDGGDVQTAVAHAATH